MPPLSVTLELFFRSVPDDPEIEIIVDEEGVLRCRVRKATVEDHEEIERH